MKKVIELWCWHGRNAKYLSSKWYKVLGVDLSEDNILECKKRYPETEFKVMKAERLDLESWIYDAVYAMDILEHVDDIDKTISEISRILKKWWKLYANIPAEKSEKWLLKIRPTYHKEIHHVRIFKHDELSLLCKDYWLNLVKKKHHWFIQHLELYYMFTRNKKSETQLWIGTWRDDYISMFLHSITILTDPILFQTPLKRFPIWIITLPIWYFINSIGNLYFPKSVYFEYIKP